MKRSDKNLTLLQKGALQKTFAFFVYAFIASSLAFLLDYIDKHTFLSLIERAYHEGLLEKETFPLLQQLISTRAGHVFVLYTVLLLICGFVAWRIIRWAGHGNWSTPVTLNKAVEFKFCMNELEIADPGRAFDIAIRYTLPFYIAAEPLIDPVKEHVKARFYPYSFNAGMRDMATLERCLGRQTLCLAVEDFVALKSSYQDQLIAAHVSTIANLKKQAEGLEASLILERESCRKQQKELAALHEENRELQRKQQTLQARDGKGQETRDIRKIPFWRVAVPTIERLLRDAEPDTAYTRTEIQQAFEEELSRHPEIKGDIEALLSTGRKKESGTPYALDGWAMEIIRAALGRHARCFRQTIFCLRQSPYTSFKAHEAAYSAAQIMQGVSNERTAKTQHAGSCRLSGRSAQYA